MSDQDLQLPLISFDESKAKLIDVLVSSLPTNEELISPNPTKEFIQDILIRGQTTPIQLSKLKGGGYFVIAGRRRIKAFRALQKVEPGASKWTVIKALVYNTTEETSILAASAENNRRSTNILTDLQALDYLQKQNPHISNADMAKFSGMSQGTVKSRLKLRKLVPEIFQAFLDNKMSSNTAEKAAALSSEHQSKLIIPLMNNGYITMEDVIEVQRVRVQETVDQQLPGMNLPDLEIVASDPVIAIAEAITGFTRTKKMELGFGIYSKSAMTLIAPLIEDAGEAQTMIENYQANVEDPSDLILVQLWTI